MSCMSKRKIAITGTIASGKSSVCAYLKSCGYDVFDCDHYDHELLKIGNCGYEVVNRYFDVIDQNGNIDRHRLAEIVFNDESKRRLLNDLLHPLIKEGLISYQNEYMLSIAEVPILYEVGWQELFDHVLLIVADKKDILKRLIDKGYDIVSAKKRIASQMDVKKKIELADYVIYNNKDLDTLYTEVDRWRKKLSI